MIENTKPIKNPLTLIAIFAGIAEILLTVALKFINQELQYIFICFVIGFPILLIILFFVILILKPGVLYAPSDFKNEDNFLVIMDIYNQKINKSKIRSRK